MLKYLGMELHAWRGSGDRQKKRKKIVDSEIRNLLARREINPKDGDSRSLRNDAMCISIQKKSQWIFLQKYLTFYQYLNYNFVYKCNLMFIGPCIIVIVEE